MTDVLAMIAIWQKNCLCWPTPDKSMSSISKYGLSYSTLFETIPIHSIQILRKWIMIQMTCYLIYSVIY